MKYFISTKYIEDKQDKTFLGFKYGETKPTIDLISIGIVSEDMYNYNPDILEDMKKDILLPLDTKIWANIASHNNEKSSRQYYAISKDFNLKAAWNNELVRENVLEQIHDELSIKEYYKFCKENPKVGIGLNEVKKKFTFKDLKHLLNKYGKTNKQIAEEIIEFTHQKAHTIETGYKPDDIEFYGYYSDYDWVVFCQLFGTMMDLPKGFPMYCIDLKQTLDEYIVKYFNEHNTNMSFKNKLNFIQKQSIYPKQTNEHNALADAKWNYELYKFLNTL